MKDLPLNTLRAFAAVYETGGIRPAGRRLNVTHSSISRHLRELEAWLGAPLFVANEGGRSVVFSPEGEALGKSVLKSLGDMNAAVSVMRESKHANVVAISTTPSFATRWLLPRLPDFEAGHPNIEVSIVLDQQRTHPGEAGADIAIRMGAGPWPGLSCHPFMNDRLFPVMSPSYWEHSGRPTSIDELAQLRLLHDRDPNASWAAWKKNFGPADLDTRHGSRFTSSDLVLRAAERGLGVALARETFALEDLEANLLVRPFGPAAVELSDAYWIVHDDRPLVRKAAISVFEWLASYSGRTGQ